MEVESKQLIKIKRGREKTSNNKFYEEHKCDQCDGINFEMIANKIACVNKLLEKMIKKNDEIYFSIFTFYLYNYEKWFAIQSSRSSKKQKQQQQSDKKY